VNNKEKKIVGLFLMVLTFLLIGFGFWGTSFAHIISMDNELAIFGLSFVVWFIGFFLYDSAKK
jgi:hypothetical protein